MQLRIATLLALTLAQGARAQSPGDPPCEYSVSKKISFATARADDRLTISIGKGACHSAELSIVVTSNRGKVLYRYAAPFKQHVATNWSEPSLPAEAREFVERTAADAIVPRQEYPAPKPPGEGDGGDAELTVPLSVFRRLVLSRQPMLYHPAVSKPKCNTKGLNEG